MEDKFWKDFKVNKELNEKQNKIIKTLIEKYRDICSIEGTKLGRTNIVKHRINTGNNEPIKSQPYKTNQEKKRIIKEEIDKMIKDGVIKKSWSPWSSPVVIVEKKDGSKRFCIDYRKINKITEIDAHPLPRMDDMLEPFLECNWFSSMDLASGYWQIEMEEEDKKKTAFTCHLGLYEFEVMPFGLTNAPPTFQRMMNELLKDWLYEFTMVYLDDIIIYSKTFEEHIEHIEKVLKKLKEVNLMIKLKKCKWCEENIEYLGHIVGKDGLKPDPKKIEKVKKIEVPKTVRDIRSFLGLCSYYRKFVKGFSKIAKPLNELLKKDKEFLWGEKQQEAFEILKEKLIEHPILIYPDFNKEFILITDASGTGLGAILTQLDEENRERVIAYASRSLVQAERNYPITDQECLAVVWGIEYFHKYLTGRKFTIITDHSALKYINTCKVPKGRRGKWMMKLQEYNFEIKHRPGKENSNADALSRLNHGGNRI